MDRKETNSITHLVKIVAAEVAKKAIEEIVPKMIQDVIIEQQFEQNLSNAGAFWNNNEDNSLYSEFEHMISTLARKHGRSYGSIECRIKHLNILKY